ncbi:MAG: hypothetical protein K1W00_04910 [Lachnospiraceae bacterium]
MNSCIDEKDYSRFIPNAHFELIPIKNLVSDQNYQRNLSEQHIERTAKNFDLNQVNPVKVSRRNGVNYVFNGQHTIEIIALISESRETPVWCMVYDNLEYKQEANIFANQMKYTKPLSPYEIFMANIEADNDKQMLIKTLIEDYDLCITSKPKPGGICAVATIERIFDKYGSDILETTLRLIIGTWEGVPQSFSANMLSGISRLVCCYGHNLKENIFKEKLSRVSCKEISRLAKERRNGSLGYSEAILQIYNKKNQSNPLRQNKLYLSNSKFSNPLTNEYTYVNSNFKAENEGLIDSQLDFLNLD